MKLNQIFIERNQEFTSLIKRLEDFNLCKSLNQNVM